MIIMIPAGRRFKSRRNFDLRPRPAAAGPVRGVRDSALGVQPRRPAGTVTADSDGCKSQYPSSGRGRAATVTVPGPRPPRLAAAGPGRWPGVARRLGPAGPLLGPSG